MVQKQKRKAAIYARFSTDMQRDRSIEDQFALCRQHAKHLDCEIVAEYSDRAQSGASVFGRNGVLDLIAGARNKEFEVIIVEALDRLSRDQEDLAGMYKRFTFSGVVIEAVHDGRADPVQIGIRGMLGSLYLADLAHKVRRGLQGVVRDGRNPGGRAYGYTPRKGEPGILDINEAEAEVVRRIFKEYILGKSPRHIARDLNTDGVPPPRAGGSWNASTINGNMQRACGILQNPLYKGELVWNRIKMVRDPMTGKRVSRPNPESEWQIVSKAELAIVDPETWAKAQDRKVKNHKDWETGAHRPRQKHMFSGLLRCGVCGSGMSLDGSKDGHRTIRCSRFRESSSCTNGKRVRLDRVEELVITSLRQEISEPGSLKLYIDEYLAETKRLADQTVQNRDKIAAKIAEVRASIMRLVDAMATGLMERADVQPRYEELKAQQMRLEGELELAENGIPDLKIIPAAVERYKEVVERLSESLSNAMEEDLETRAAFREMVDSILVFTEPQLTIQVIGKLDALTGGLPPGDRGIQVVAGARIFNHPPVVKMQSTASEAA